MATSEITTCTKQADGLSIRVAERNDQSGPTLLLLSPWPESLYAWEQLLPRFAEVGRVLAIDLPGFGQSEARIELFSPQAMGRFLVRLIDEWDLDAPHVIGPDVGCPAALFAAAESPKSVSSLVVGNGATAWPLQVDGPLKDLIANPDFESLLAVDGEAAARQSQGLHEGFEASGAAVEDYAASYAGSRFGESARFVRNYPNDLPVLLELLPSMSTPVLVLAGDHDPMVPAGNARDLAARLPVSELKLLDAGHFAWEDRAQEYGDAAVAWIQGGYRLGGDG
jgi:pimeloyl-ACP methyl ester carboxylesterase